MSVETQVQAQNVDELIKQEEIWYQMLKNSEKHIENLQQQLDLYSSTRNHSKEESKTISHFQNLFHYYRTDVIRNLKHRIRLDEQVLNDLPRSDSDDELIGRFMIDFNTRKDELDAFFNRFIDICDNFNSSNFHRKVFSLN